MAACPGNDYTVEIFLFFVVTIDITSMLCYILVVS